MTTIFLGLAILMCCLVWVFLKLGAGFRHSGRESVELALPPNLHVFRGPESKRRSERIYLVLPIRVTGQDVSGEAFQEDTRTRNLSGFGASIFLSRQLRPGQEIVISRENKSRSATCRVVYEMERREGTHIYGVAFVDPNVDIWAVRELLVEALAVPQPIAPQGQ